MTSSDCSVHAGQDSLVSSPNASHGIISEHVAAGNTFINLCRARYKFITLEFSTDTSRLLVERRKPSPSPFRSIGSDL